jgi:hypothetical protein
MLDKEEFAPELGDYSHEKWLGDEDLKEGSPIFEANKLEGFASTNPIQGLMEFVKTALAKIF